MVLASAEAVAGLLCSLGVQWMAAGMQVCMLLEQAVTLMLTARPHRAAAFLWLQLRGGALGGLSSVGKDTLGNEC